MRIVLFFIIINSLYSLPRFALEQGSSCINCHINPTGGGMRNDYGSNVYTLDELTIRKWIGKGNEDWDGYIIDNVQIGGEFRIQSIDGNSGSATFPMQAELYGNIDINKDVDLYFEIPIGGGNYDFFLLFNELPGNAWLKMGQTYPNYGLMVDDHTAFIKSGNGDKASLIEDNLNLDRGFRDLFDPSKSKPILIEAGFNFTEGLSMTIDLSQSLIDYPKDKIINYSTSLNYTKDFTNWTMMFGTSIMKENDIQLNGLFGGFSVSDITMTFEIDRAYNLFEISSNKSSIASYAQFVYKPVQGLHLIAKYDFFDFNEQIANGAISRFSYGLEFYPLNLLEIKFQIREYKYNFVDPVNYITDYNDGGNKSEYLLQIHAWF